MSFSKTGKVFPKEGNLFPVDAASYACVVAAALRDELGQSHHAVKTVKGLRILTSMRVVTFLSKTNQTFAMTVWVSQTTRDIWEHPSGDFKNMTQ